MKPPAEAFALALLAAQKEACAVRKGSKNNFHKYDYASAEDMIEAGSAWLNSAGLVMFLAGQCLDMTGKHIELVLQFKVMHTSGECMELIQRYPVSTKGKEIDKATLGTQSEALAYALRSLLLIKRGNKQPDISGREDRPQNAQRQRHQPPADRPDRPLGKLPDQSRRGIYAAARDVGAALGVNAQQLIDHAKEWYGIKHLDDFAHGIRKNDYTNFVAQLRAARAAVRAGHDLALLTEKQEGGVWTYDFRKLPTGNLPPAQGQEKA